MFLNLKLILTKKNLRIPKSFSFIEKTFKEILSPRFLEENINFIREKGQLIAEEKIETKSSWFKVVIAYGEEEVTLDFQTDRIEMRLLFDFKQHCIKGHGVFIEHNEKKEESYDSPIDNNHISSNINYWMGNMIGVLNIYANNLVEKSDKRRIIIAVITTLIFKAKSNNVEWPQVITGTNP